MSNDDSSQAPASSPPSNSSSSSTPSGPPPSDSSSSSPSSSPPSSPPPSNSSSSPPSSPPRSPPPSSPPPSSPPASSPPPQSSSSPPPQSSSSPPPQSSTSPPPPSSSSPSPPKSSSSPPPPSPPPSPSSLSPPNSNVFSPPPPANKSTPSSVSPPPPPSSTSSASSGGSNSNILMYSIIGGVGFMMLFLALVIICAVRSRRKRKQLKQNQMQFYGEHSNRYNKGHGDPYYGQHPIWHGPPKGGDHQNWHNYPQGGDNGSKVLVPSGGGWPSATPPPPPMISSGEISSNFSGPVRPPLPPPPPNIALGFNKSTFTYDELAAATAGFSQAHLLGQGGFGYVHKGVLPNGKEIAVKSLKSGSGQGEREFQAEVEIISRVHHRHLVSLVGYCIAGGLRMLVYEFVPNNTLEHHLHGKGMPVMDWSSRLRIALGSAKGLAYLHEDCHPKIIHRDIKAANILLDFNFEAMVADFGLAKLSSDTHTHVSTRVMGTFGYLAPEYASSGKLTEKSDVFSFGVMLLELITGRKPVDPNMMDDSLVDWARPYMNEALEFGKYDGLVDPRLENNFAPHEMARMVACAAASVRHSARKRPKMSQIVRTIEGDSSLDDLNDGVRPGQSSIYGSSTSTDYSQSSYNADLKKFRKMALGSQEFSSEYGGSSGNSREMATPTPGTERYKL